MHILGLILSVLIGISVWWWRLRALKQASDTVIDAADRFRGARRRKEIEAQNNLSPIAAIEEPVTAAATFIHLVVGQEVWPMVQGRLTQRLADVSSDAHAEEAVTYAEWAVAQPIEDWQALGLLTKMLRERLTLEERQDLAEMLRDAAESGDPELQAKASREAIALIN